MLLFLTALSEIIKSISCHKDGHRVTFLKPGLILFQENKKSGRKFYIALRSSGGIYDYVLRSREEPLSRGREEGAWGYESRCFSSRPGFVEKRWQGSQRMIQHLFSCLSCFFVLYCCCCCCPEENAEVMDNWVWNKDFLRVLCKMFLFQFTKAEKNSEFTNAA